MRKRILVLSFSRLSHDPRVTRQLEALMQEYEVAACGIGPPAVEGVRAVPLREPKGIVIRRMFTLLKLLRLYSLAEIVWPLSREAYRACRTLEYDLVLANDVTTLPVAVRLARLRGVPLVLDAHEYAPEEFSDRFIWRLLHRGLNVYILGRYLPQVKAMLTVSKGIAQAYRDKYGVVAEVVLNAPRYQQLPVRRVVDGEPIRLVHHGAAIPSRRLEEMIRAVKLLDEKFTLDLFLVADTRENRLYLEWLRNLASDNPRIRFREPVPPGDVVRTLSRYDVGIFLLAPTNVNNLHALPNKLFEFVQARLAVVVSPSPDMAELVREWGIGVVAEDFSAESFARCIAALTADRINAYKEASDRAARKLNAEEEGKKLLRVVREALEG